METRNYHTGNRFVKAFGIDSEYWFERSSPNGDYLSLKAGETLELPRLVRLKFGTLSITMATGEAYQLKKRCAKATAKLGYSARGVAT
jgi:hypothetical protein